MTNLRALALALLGLLFIPTIALAQQTYVAPPVGIGCAYNSSLPTITAANAGWVQCDSAGRLLTTQTDTAGSTDPCQSSAVLKSSAPISVATAATTALVAVSGTQSVYVCAYALTIAPSATSADSAKFEYGTGTACATGATALTGTFASGDLTTSAAPLAISQAGAFTLFTAPSTNGLCIVTAGTTVNVQGVITYVQQ